MGKYIPRTCPKCGDYFAVVVNEPPRKGQVLPVRGFCATCGYHLREWRVIIGDGRWKLLQDVPARKNLRDC